MHVILALEFKCDIFNDFQTLRKRDIASIQSLVVFCEKHDEKDENSRFLSFAFLFEVNVILTAT